MQVSTHPAEISESRQEALWHKRATPVVRFFSIVALVLWIGGIVFFGAVMAPVLVSVLPNQHLVGLVVGRALLVLHWIGIGCGIVLLLATVAMRHLQHIDPRTKILLIAGMLLMTAMSQFLVIPRMEELRKQAGGEIITLRFSDPLRQNFDRLHQWSTRLETGVLLLGVILVAQIARE